MATYIGSFEDSASATVNILQHAGPLGVEVVMVTFGDGGAVLVETASPFPSDQLEHLGLTEAV